MSDSKVIDESTKARKTIENLLNSFDGNIWNYRYTRAVIKSATHHNLHFIEVVSKILEEDTNNGTKVHICSLNVFTEYYLIAHYYRLFNKKDLLIELIDNYKDCFDKSMLFNEEVKCWYFKRKGEWKEAYKSSKELLENFDILNNPGVYGNYISTVISMLEIEYHSRNSENPTVFWTDESKRIDDWQQCMNFSKQTLSNDIESTGEKVGIQYAKMGMLLIYTPGLENLPIKEVSNTIDKADEYFELAIMYEDQKAKNYDKRCMEYRQMQVQGYLRKLDIISNISNNELQCKIDGLSEAEEELKENVDNQLTRSLEIISIFTAAITLIITSVGIISNLSFEQASRLLVVITCSWCLVYSVFVFMLHSGTRMIKSIVIALLMTILLFFLI